MASTRGQDKNIPTISGVRYPQNVTVEGGGCCSDRHYILLVHPCCGHNAILLIHGVKVGHMFQ